MTAPRLEDDGYFERVTLYPRERFYEPRVTIGGGEVYDVPPFEAESWVRDGWDKFGLLYSDGTVDWLGAASQAFGENQPTGVRVDDQ